MLAKIKALIRYGYYRSALFRRLMGWISVTSGRMLPLHTEFIKIHPGEWVGKSRFPHQPDERKFVDWIGRTYPNCRPSTSIHPALFATA